MAKKSLLVCTQEQLEKVSCENRKLRDQLQKTQRELLRYKRTFGDWSPNTPTQECDSE